MMRKELVFRFVLLILIRSVSVYVYLTHLFPSPPRSLDIRTRILRFRDVFRSVPSTLLLSCSRDSASSHTLLQTEPYRIVSSPHPHIRIDTQHPTYPLIFEFHFHCIPLRLLCTTSCSFHGLHSYCHPTQPKPLSYRILLP